jgi:hypothetical protein
MLKAPINQSGLSLSKPFCGTPLLSLRSTRNLNQKNKRMEKLHGSPILLLEMLLNKVSLNSSRHFHPMNKLPNSKTNSKLRAKFYKEFLLLPVGREVPSSSTNLRWAKIEK